MQRFLYVKAGRVTNVVGYPDGVVPPLLTSEGEDIILDPTGTTSVGDAFDTTSALQDRSIDKVDLLVFKELFRLTNAVRAAQIPALPAITAAQYRAFLKTQL